MTISELSELVTSFAPIVAAITGVITVYLGRTIHRLVNSAMTAVKADLAIANQRISALQDLVAALTVNKHGVSVPAEMMVPPPLPPTVAKVP